MFLIMKYEIWSEGFLITGMEGDPANASLVATIEAESFQAACDLYYKDNNLYDAKSLTFWGCRLFDNEASARLSFG